LSHKKDRFPGRIKGAQMRFLKPVCGLTILDSQMDTQKQTEKRNRTGRSESAS
jgi:hypothetical protein